MSQVGICDVKSCEKLEKNRADLRQVNINNITYDLCKVCYDGLIGFIAQHLNQGKPLVDKSSPFDTAKYFEFAGIGTSTSTPYLIQEAPKWKMQYLPKIASATDIAYPIGQEIKFTDEK